MRLDGELVRSDPGQAWDQCVRMMWASNLFSSLYLSFFADRVIACQDSQKHVTQEGALCASNS